VPALYFKSASSLLRRRRCSSLPLTPPPRRSTVVRRARLTISVRFHVYHYSAVSAAAYVSERGTASGVGCHGLTTVANACHFTYTACYTLVSVLVLGIGIGSGQYYWILGIGWLSWYRSNPRYHDHLSCMSLPK